MIKSTYLVICLWVALVGLAAGQRPASPAIAPEQAIAAVLDEVGPNDFRISEMGPDGDNKFDAFDPAVAYNSTNNEYLVVWSSDDNMGGMIEGESEIFGQRLDAASGAKIGGDFRISEMGPDGNISFDANDPTVAYNSTNNEYLVVWSGDDNSGGLVESEFEIYGQRLDAASGAEIGGDFRISDMGGDGLFSFGALDPAVAYNSTNNEYLVVWSGDDNSGGLVDNDFEIFGQRLAAATGNEIGLNDFRLSDMGGTGTATYHARVPAVAYNSTNNEYLVVWSGDDNTALLVDNEFEIFGQRLEAATGNETGLNDFLISFMGPFGNTNYGASGPDVVYNGVDNEYLVVWWGDDNVSGRVNDEFEIFGQRMNATTGAAIGVTRFRLSEVGGTGNPSYDAEAPAASYDSTNHRYLVVWTSNEPVVPGADKEDEIYGQWVEADTGAQIGDDFRLSDLGPDGDNDFDALNPAVAYNSANNQALVVWYGDDNSGGLVEDEHEIFGQRLGEPASSPGPQQVFLPLVLK